MTDTESSSSHLLNDDSVQAATASDLDRLIALEVNAQRRPWTRDALAEELEHEDAAIFVVRPDDSDERLDAMVAVRVTLDEAWILQVGTRTSARRRGLARLLLGHALAFARTRGATSGWLEVRASNEDAKRLYQSLGFDRVATRAKYYPPFVEGEAREDALLFRVDLAERTSTR